MTNRFRLLLLTVVAVIGATTRNGFASGGFGGTNDDAEHEDGEAYAIGLWGDLLYSTAQSNTGVPNLIADMNSHNLAFTVHDGDLKSGSSPCTDNVYTQALSYFNSLRGPAAFTPGDNDWTDCDRPSAGAYDPRERLRS
jgi:hypothetical protein